jgi:hypothetical protein
MNSDYERHIRERFAAAAVALEPFPHLVVRDVLPAGLYEEIEANCPSALECFVSTLRVQWRRSRPMLGVRLPRPYRTQQQAMISFRPGDLTTPPLGRYIDRWSRYRPYFDLVDYLTIKAYEPVTVAYAAQLRRAGFIRQPQPLQIGQGIFTHRTETWRIPPHVHASAQIIQGMIYFPLPGSTPEQGTVLYRLKGRKSVPGADLMRTFEFAADEVEEAGLMPYHPNTLASFLNTPLSIHASPDVPGPARRYTFTAAVLPGVTAPDRVVDLAEFAA